MVSQRLVSSCRACRRTASTSARSSQSTISLACSMSAFGTGRSPPKYLSSYEPAKADALEVYARHPGRFALVKPVDPSDPAVAETVAEWAATLGTVGDLILIDPKGYLSGTAGGINTGFAQGDDLTVLILFPRGNTDIAISSRFDIVSHPFVRPR